MGINDYLTKPVDISNVIGVGKGAFLDLQYCFLLMDAIPMCDIIKA